MDWSGRRTPAHRAATPNSTPVWRRMRPNLKSVWTGPRTRVRRRCARWRFPSWRMTAGLRKRPACPIVRATEHADFLTEVFTMKVKTGLRAGHHRGDDHDHDDVSHR